MAQCLRGLQAWAWLPLASKLKIREGQLKVREQDVWKPGVFVMRRGMKESPEKIIFSPVSLHDPRSHALSTSIW